MLWKYNKPLTTIGVTKMTKIHKLSYSAEEYAKVVRRVLDWEKVAGFIKDSILEFDYTKNDPIATFNAIDHVLDDAFCHLPTAVHVIDESRKMIKESE